MSKTPLEIKNLEEKVKNRIKQIGWIDLTPIQEKTFPVVLRKKNTLIISPTGSGKTEAAVIPIFAQLSGSREKETKKGIRAVYITPLRALNRDILRRIISYAELDGLSAEIRHGDTPVKIRRRMVDNPPDILITTPETLSIIISSPRLRSHLKDLKWVIVDELHELIGSERGTHLTLSLERLQSIAEDEIIRIGLSATLKDLDSAAQFLVGTNRKCAIMVDDTIRDYDIKCQHIEGTLYDVIDFVVNYVKKEKMRTVLIFANTRNLAEYVGAILKEHSPEIPVEVHHGSLARDVRSDAETKLRAGEAYLVVCTSSLELGLDIGFVDLVIQLGSSRQSLKLIQRVGRSKHRLGETAKGLVVTYDLDDELESYALVDRIRKHSLEGIKIHHKAYDVLAHHLAGLSLENKTVTTDDALKTFKRAYPFKDVTLLDIDSCLVLLQKQGIINYNGKIIRRKSQTYNYYYGNVSTIPDYQHFTVIDASSNKRIGNLDQRFIGEYGEPGKPFVLKGTSWRILSVNDEKSEVHVEPMFREISTIPYWIGEMIPVDLETAKKAGSIRSQVLGEKNIKVSEAQKIRLSKSKDVLKTIPDDKILLIEKNGSNLIIIHSCLGTRVNQTLATLLSTLISSNTGYLVETRSDAYRILLSSYGRLDSKDVIKIFFDDYDIEDILSVSVIGTHPLNWKTWHVAKKFGIISKDGHYDRRATRLIQKRYANTVLYEEVLRELFLEKYDVQKTKEILSEIKKKKIPVVNKNVEDFSPLAKPILEYATSFVSVPTNIEKAVLELVRERLHDSKIKILCINCSWESNTVIKNIKEALNCPRCNSRWITCTYSSNDELVKIIIKKVRNRKLTPEEEKKYKKAWKVSSLVQNFGRNAPLVLSGYGIGPDSAARILRKSIDDEDLIKKIYLAEKTFVRTRPFWDKKS